MNQFKSHIHIGRAIEQKLSDLKMSKTEFGRRIGIPSQNVNRILERDTIDTGKLIQISKILNFNFFSLFSEEISVQTREAGRDYVEHGKIEYIAPDASSLATEQQLSILKSQIKDKERIIAFYMDKYGDILK